MFAQGGLCFFCKEPLPRSEASVEHLVAVANGGANHDGNCVACCKGMNALLGSMSLKEKFQVVLNQQGRFACPSRKEAATVAATPLTSSNAQSVPPHGVAAKIAVVLDDLRKRKTAKPRTVKTLTSTIDATFQKTLSEAEVKALIDCLCAKGYVLVAGTKVTYDLPAK